MAITKDEAAAIARNVAAMIRSKVQPALDELAKRNSALELRLLEVEAGCIKYLGVYKPGDSYQRGAWVSWGGSVWSATQDVQGIPPASDSRAWVKAIARGNDGASAYQSAKRCGFAGSERDWIESVQKGEA